MALFKKPNTAEKIMALIKELPDEELDKLGDMLSEDTDKDGKPDTMEQIEEAEENIDKKGKDSQTEQDRIDESVGEQEELDGDKDSQDAKDRVDEAEGEEKEQESKKSLDKDEIIALLDEILPDKVKEILKAHETEESDRESKDDVDKVTNADLTKVESIYNS